jgi:hypothetical protein
MENPAAFCLNDAMRQWRRNLEASCKLSTDQADELETHLRDAVHAITARGVSMPAAFQMALEQFGPNTAIAEEFAKSSPARPWLTRAFWIISGLFLIKVPLYLGALGFIFLLYQVVDWTGRSDVAVAVAHLGSLLIKVALVFCFWRLGRVPRERLNAFALMCVRRPLVPILFSAILVVSLNPLFRWAHQAITATHGTLPDVATPLVRNISISAYVVESLLWLALPFWLVRRLTRNGTTGDPTPWLDRCLCISIGVALQVVSAPLLGPFGRIAHGLSSLVTTNREWCTVGWAAGMWLASAAAVATVVSALHWCPNFCLNAKRWIIRQPFRAFIGTAILIFLLSWALRLTMYIIPGIPGLSGNAERLLQDIPSLVFLGALFWLARRQFVPKQRQFYKPA